jgi:cystathionine beta-synthase
LNGALEFLKTHPLGQKVAQQEGANVVIILPDSLRNYITKDWLVGDEELAKAASTQKNLIALANL